MRGINGKRNEVVVGKPITFGEGIGPVCYQLEQYLQDFHLSLKVKIVKRKSPTSGSSRLPSNCLLHNLNERKICGSISICSRVSLDTIEN